MPNANPPKYNNLKKIPIFAGIGDDVMEFFRTYECVAMSNFWDDDTKCVEFPVYLVGDAATEWSKLSAAEQSDWDAITKYFQRKYNPEELTDTYKQELHVATQQADEDVLKFSHRITVLARKGYPSLEYDQRALIMKGAFLNGLRQDMRILTETMGPTNFDDAVVKARRAELSLRSMTGGKSVLSFGGPSDMSSAVTGNQGAAGQQNWTEPNTGFEDLKAGMQEIRQLMSEMRVELMQSQSGADQYQPPDGASDVLQRGRSVGSKSQRRPWRSWTSDGRPICDNCGRAMHVARVCNAWEVSYPGRGYNQRDWGYGSNPHVAPENDDGYQTYGQPPQPGWGNQPNSWNDGNHGYRPRGSQESWVPQRAGSPYPNGGGGPPGQSGQHFVDPDGAPRVRFAMGGQSAGVRKNEWPQGTGNYYYSDNQGTVGFRWNPGCAIATHNVGPVRNRGPLRNLTHVQGGMSLQSSGHRFLCKPRHRQVQMIPHETWRPGYPIWFRGPPQAFSSNGPAMWNQTAPVAPRCSLGMPPATNGTIFTPLITAKQAAQKKVPDPTPNSAPVGVQTFDTASSTSTVDANEKSQTGEKETQTVSNSEDNEIANEFAKTRIPDVEEEEDEDQSLEEILAERMTMSAVRVPIPQYCPSIQPVFGRDEIDDEVDIPSRNTELPNHRNKMKTGWLLVLLKVLAVIVLGFLALQGASDLFIGRTSVSPAFYGVHGQRGNVGKVPQYPPFPDVELFTVNSIPGPNPEGSHVRYGAKRWVRETVTRVVKALADFLNGNGVQDVPYFSVPHTMKTPAAASGVPSCTGENDPTLRPRCSQCRPPPVPTPPFHGNLPRGPRRSPICRSESPGLVLDMPGDGHLVVEGPCDGGPVYGFSAMGNDVV